MKKIALVGGGTGGHITPLVSIYNRLRSDKGISSGAEDHEASIGLQPDFDFFWIGEKGGMEESIAKDKGIRFYGITAGKLRRYFTLQTIVEPFKILGGIKSSVSILRREKPDVIFSKGGFVSLPVAIVAKILGIRLFLHESDTIPGLANRYVGRFATRIYLGFKEAARYFDPAKVKVVGQILNQELFAESDSRAQDRGSKTNLLVIAGSQGSTRIFKKILDNMESLSEFDIDIVLGSLNKHLKAEFDAYPNVRTYEFINQKELGRILEKTDVAITRAGATSLAELEAFDIKMIIIPLKESANNHQLYNAIAYKNLGEVMISEEDMETITDAVLHFHDYKKTPHEHVLGGAIDVIAEDLR